LHRRIRQLAEEKGVPVIAFAEDVAASGGYWLALAGDEIFGEETSLIGSIGVVSGGFGAHELIARLGIERRLYTAGAHKSLLDPFLPENPADIDRLPDSLFRAGDILLAGLEIPIPTAIRAMRRGKSSGRRELSPPTTRRRKKGWEW
jgi:serine protease SohB